MKRFHVIRTAVAAVALFGLAASTLWASPSAVLSQDEMAGVWGSDSGACNWAVDTKPCSITFSCRNASPRCDLGDCSAACTGAGNDAICVAGTAYKSCVEAQNAGGCGFFYQFPQTCSFAGWPPPVPCRCVGNATPSNIPCFQFTATTNGACGAGN